jgi:hypothetical protein
MSSRLSIVRKPGADGQIRSLSWFIGDHLAVELLAIIALGSLASLLNIQDLTCGRLPITRCGFLPSRFD